MVPPGLAVVLFAVFVIPTCGIGGTVALLVHGGAVLPGRQRPPGGSAEAVFVTCAGGVALTVAVTV